MRKTIFLLLPALLLTSSALAEPPPHPGPHSQNSRIVKIAGLREAKAAARADARIKWPENSHASNKIAAKKIPPQ